MKLGLSAVLLTLSLGALAAPKFSANVFQRPFTMPRNSFETGLIFDNNNIAQLAVDYGVTDKIQLGLSWKGLGEDNAPAEAISLNAAAYLFSTRYVSSMAKLSMPIYFQTQVVQELSGGMPTYIPLVRGHLNLVLLENLATLNWKESVNAEFAFHVRLSWQATHSLCLNLSTTAGILNTSGSHKHLFDTTPLNFSALYAITPMIDVLGQVGYKNLQTTNGSTGLTMMLGVLFRGGEIEG